jgi:hypothetical protein
MITMVPLIQRIKELSRIYHAETIAIRRHLHLHPELSGEEKETSAFVAKTLSKLGIPYRDHVGVTALLPTSPVKVPKEDASLFVPTWTLCPFKNSTTSPINH